MNAGEILAQIDGLTADKLTYFVRAGYVRPVKVKRGSLYYNEFSENDLKLTRRAWEFICQYDMRTRAAFERAQREIDGLQLRLFE